MARIRLGLVSAVVVVMVVGLPLPAPAAPRVPETVARAIAIGGAGIARTSSAAAASVAPEVLELPINANLVAVSFRSDATDHEALEEELVIEARFRTRDGWSSFKRLWVEPDEAPDLADQKPSERVFTGPAWVGTADAMQLRVSSPAGGPSVSDLRAHLINTKGDAHEPNIFQRAVGAVSRLLRGTDAEAFVGQPGIISRAQWGADESWRECCPRYADNVHLAFVHHTVNSNSYSRSESAALVRGVYRFHAKDRGWSDIGYNFIVDRYGQIFEGRAGGITLPVIGAHTLGFNTGSTGISLLGDFTSSTPTGAMVSALQNVLAWKLDVHGVPPTGTVTRISAGSDKYPPGQAASFNRISGHRDGQSTSCPGARAYALLPSIRSAVSNIGLPKLYLPTVSNPVIRPDGDSFDETTTFGASFSTTINWTAVVRDLSTGVVQRSFNGRGTSMSVTWDGRKDGGAFIPTGPWQYVLLGTDDAGRQVRSALGTLWAVTSHPDGTLLRSGSQRVVIDGGQARPVPSTLVRDSWYRSGEEVSTGPAEIGRYPSGSAMTLREGTIVRTPGGTRYIFSDGELRRFASDAVYTALGYGDAAALPITDSEVDSFSDGPDVTSVTVHPDGAIVRAGDGSLWIVSGGSRSRVATDTMRRSWYRDAEVVPATAGDVALPVGTPASYREGTLFQMPNGSLWIYTNGIRLGMDATMFAAMGYSSGATLALSDSEAATIPSQTLGPNTAPPIPPGPSSPPGRPVPGDWDGNGSVTPGDVRGNTWYVNNGYDAFEDVKVAYGKSTDRPLAGDWDGNGSFTPGVVRGNVWYVNNAFDGAADFSFAYGRSTDVPIAGDWDGSGSSTPAIVRGNVWYVNNGIDGAADFSFPFGRAGDIPVAGDWDGNGTVTPGVVRGNVWYLNNGFDGAAELALVYGKSSDAKVAGDWDGDGDWSHGVVRGATWYLRNVVAEGGAADVVYQNRM
jgi:hypothetical protein